MTFPVTPTNGQTTVVNNITYSYSTSTQSWTRVAGQVTATTYLNIVNNTQSTSTTTGALTVVGGVGVGGVVNVGQNVTVGGASVVTTASIIGQVGISVASSGTNNIYIGFIPGAQGLTADFGLLSDTTGALTYDFGTL